MKTIFAALLFAGVALPATAQDEDYCKTFISEFAGSEFSVGVRRAEYIPTGLAITDIESGKRDEYYIMSVGTGMPARAAINVRDKNDGLAIREYKGALIIDMEVFEPTCK